MSIIFVYDGEEVCHLCWGAGVYQPTAATTVVRRCTQCNGRGKVGHPLPHVFQNDASPAQTGPTNASDSPTGAGKPIG